MRSILKYIRSKQNQEAQLSGAGDNVNQVESFAIVYSAVSPSVASWGPELVAEECFYCRACAGLYMSPQCGPCLDGIDCSC
jgi:hypothetical protein